MTRRHLSVFVLAVALTACGTMEPNSSFLQAVNGTPTPGNATTPGNTNTVTPGNTNTQTSTPGNTNTQTSTPGGGNTQTSTPGGGNNSSTQQPTTGNSIPNPTPGVPNFASDVGVTATSITIGNVTGVTGALGPDAFGVTLTGLKVWVDAINAQGGINGRKVILDSCDDGQDASQNLACTQTLLPKVFAFIGNNSLSSSGSAHPEFAAGVPDIGYPLNNGYYKYPNMFSLYGTDYPRNGTQVGFNGKLENTPGIYRWFADQRGIKRAAFFYYNQNASQQQGYAGETDSAPYGIKTVYEGGGSHQGENFAAPNFDSDVIAMQHMGAGAPQAMFDAMDVAGNQKLCASMDRYGFTVTAKVSTIEVWDQSIGTSGWSKPCRDSIYVATNSLSYADSSNPQVAAYLRAFNTYAPGALQAEWTLQGYAVGQMFADGVASMGAAVTRKGFISWLDNLPPASSPTPYTDHGIFSPISYRQDNPSTPRPDCNTIAQWQDSAGTFVTRAPLTTCYNDPLISSNSSPDGS